MSIGTTTKIEVITFDSNTTYRTDIAKGFSVNPEAPYSLINNAVQSLMTLSTNTYSDTILQSSISLNELYELKLLPKNYKSTTRRMLVSEKQIQIEAKKKSYTGGQSTQIISTILPQEGAITGCSIKNFSSNRTSDSGDLSFSFTTNVSTGLQISLEYSSAWEGTINDSDAYLEIKWKPFNSYPSIILTSQIPIKLKIEEW